MIYLIASESNQLINDELQKINNDCDSITYIDYNNSTIDDILVEASYYSLFGDKKILIVKNADFFASGKINENDTDKLLNYFNEPNELTKLIFVTNNKLDLRKKITKEIKSNHNLIVLDSLKPRDILNKIRELIVSEGYKVDDDTINYIMVNNANNYDLVYNEMNKIFLYYQKPRKILYDDVKNIVAVSADTNNFKFVESVVLKNLKMSFKLYDDLKVMKVEPLALISLLAREYRLMLFSKILKLEHYSNYDICSLLGLQDWQLEKILRNSKLLKITELEEKVCALADLDFEIKSGRIDKWIGLANFIVKSAE